MIIRLFRKKPVAPAEVLPDHARARKLVDVSIDKLRGRAAFLQANIDRDSAELHETDRMLEALIEAKGKVVIVEDAPFIDLGGELLSPIGQAAE